MPKSILTIAFVKSANQSPHIAEIKSGKYGGVSFLLNPCEASDKLLQALEETNLLIDLSLADYTNGWKNSCPTFTFTKFISQFPKGQKKSRLNINRASFSFSKYNANDLVGLSNWPTLQYLKLDYYVRQSNAKESSIEQRKYKDKQFFRNLADFIAHNNFLIKLELSNYSFSSDYIEIPEQNLDCDKLGLASYFPYGDYKQTHPEKVCVTLEEPIKQQLLKAFTTNYSLLDININEWGFLSSTALQEILKRNQAAADQLREAAKQGDTKQVELLLNKGVSVFGLDEEGNTALHYAASYGHMQIVKLLLERRADWRLSNLAEETPITLAMKFGHLKVYELLTGNKMTVSDWINFCKENYKKSSDKRINLSGCQFDDNAMPMITGLLTECATVEEIDLSLNCFSPMGVKKLCDYLKTNNSIKAIAGSQQIASSANRLEFLKLFAELLQTSIVLTQLKLTIDNTNLAEVLYYKVIQFYLNRNLNSNKNSKNCYSQIAAILTIINEIKNIDFSFDYIEVLCEEAFRLLNAELKKYQSVSIGEQPVVSVVAQEMGKEIIKANELLTVCRDILQSHRKFKYSRQVELYYKNAQDFFNKKQFSMALTLLDGIIAMQVDHQAAYLLRAQTHEALEQYPSALADYRHVLSEIEIADVRVSLRTLEEIKIPQLLRFNIAKSAIEAAIRGFIVLENNTLAQPIASNKSVNLEEDRQVLLANVIAECLKVKNIFLEQLTEQQHRYLIQHLAIRLKNFNILIETQNSYVFYKSPLHIAINPEIGNIKTNPELQKIFNEAIDDAINVKLPDVTLSPYEQKPSAQPVTRASSRMGSRSNSFDFSAFFTKPSAQPQSPSSSKPNSQPTTPTANSRRNSSEFPMFFNGEPSAPPIIPITSVTTSRNPVPRT